MLNTLAMASAEAKTVPSQVGSQEHFEQMTLLSLPSHAEHLDFHLLKSVLYFPLLVLKGSITTVVLFLFNQGGKQMEVEDVRFLFKEMYCCGSSFRLPSRSPESVSSPVRANCWPELLYYLFIYLFVFSSFLGGGGGSIMKGLIILLIC